ncbi:TPA: tyrosine-type recombinase/integrase [Photobacterium damselae]
MLTDTKLKSYLKKDRDKVARISDRDGLYVRVTKKGKVIFYFRYQINGKSEAMDIGEYPLISLQEAREKTFQYRVMITEHKNPKVEKLLQKTRAFENPTFNELLNLWYQKECAVTKKNHKSVYRRIVFNINGPFADIPADKIKTHDWLDKLESIAKKAPSMAGALLSDVRQIYALGVRRRLVEDNPIDGLTAKKDLNVEKRQNDRYLDDDEVRRIMLYVDGAEEHGVRDRLLIHLGLIYGCRMSELRLADISHFDFDDMIWTVPQENHKTGKKTKKPLLRPIIDEVVPIIKELMLFSEDGKSLITSTRTQRKFNDAFWTRWPEHINKWLTIRGEPVISDWTIHCLRKTMRTNMSAIAQPHVCEKMLGHKLMGVWSVYDQYEYIEEQRAAYKEWYHKIERIIAGADNVIALRG